ncbi:MAG: glycosyltransferase [Caldimonas sp.]
MEAEASAANRPLVSMVLLAYNQAAFVGEAIAAALAQSYRPLEIVISDDASTDGTWAAIEAAVAGYDGPHAVVLNRNSVNLGIGAHLNRMVGLASGELLAVAAGDDVSLPGRCEQTVAAWLEAGRRPDLVAGALVDVDEHGTAHGVIVPSDLATYRNAADWLAHPPFVVGASQAWTRRLYDRFGPFAAGTTAEDQLMVFRAIVSGGALTLPVPLVRYRRGGVSRRRRTLHARDVVARLLANNRSALVQLPQLLADATRAGQLDAVEPALRRQLAREEFIRDAFAAHGTSRKVAIAMAAGAVPLATRLRVLAYAAFPASLAPWFALKRWRAGRR